jgi:hypothetical protein
VHRLQDGPQGIRPTSRNASRKECFRILARSGEANVALSCRSFAANAVRLRLSRARLQSRQLPAHLATPEPIKDWSLTSLKERLIKIGAKLVSHGRYVVFQMAESPCRECYSPRSCGRRPIQHGHETFDCQTFQLKPRERRGDGDKIDIPGRNAPALTARRPAMPMTMVRACRFPPLSAVSAEQSRHQVDVGSNLSPPRFNHETQGDCENANRSIMPNADVSALFCHQPHCCHE